MIGVAICTSRCRSPNNRRRLRFSRLDTQHAGKIIFAQRLQQKLGIRSVGLLLAESLALDLRRTNQREYPVTSNPRSARISRDLRPRLAGNDGPRWQHSFLVPVI